MQACKLFLQILNKNKLLILIYCIVFFGVSLTISSSSVDLTTIESNPATFVFKDTDKEDNEKLLSYLSPYVELVDLKGQDVDEAIFYSNIVLYVEFEENYVEKILNNESDVLTYKFAPDKQHGYAILNRVTSLLNIAKTGYENGLTTKDNALSYAINIVKETQEDVTLEYTTNTNSDVMFIYNLLTYVIASVILLVVGIINYELLNKEITRRLNITPLTVKKRNLQLLLSYCVSSIILILVLSFTPMVKYGTAALDNFGFYFLNNCILVIPFVALALFVSGFCKSNMAFQGFAVAFPLVSAFLTGAMVPQEFIPDITLGIAHIFPQYYTIVANNYIDTAVSFEMLEYLKIIYPIFIISAILMVGTFVVQKLNSRKEL